MSTPLSPSSDDGYPAGNLSQSDTEPSTSGNKLGRPTAATEVLSSNAESYRSPNTESAAPAATESSDRALIAARQQERFGGVKIGSAFFGWLTATGMAVLLLALLAAAGVAFGVATDTTVDQAVQESQNATGAAKTVGLVGGILLLVILFAAYYSGGYVAGRMARFNGLRQGLAVWLWGILTALVIAAIAAIAGTKYDIFAKLNLPRLPVNEGQVTTAGLIAIGAALVAALIGAMLGGLAGMRFHRHVDAAGLEPSATERDALRRRAEDSPDN